MHLWRIVIVGLAILSIGFVSGLFLAFYLQGQAVILAAAAVIFAFVAWLGSGADIVGLLREVYKEGKDEEKRAKSVVYSSVEPQLSSLRRELVLAQRSHGDRAYPTYCGHLDAFQKLLRDAEASGVLRHISRNAPQVMNALRKVDERIGQPWIPGLTPQILSEDEVLPRAIPTAIVQIDNWLGEWDKWRS